MCVCVCVCVCVCLHVGMCAMSGILLELVLYGGMALWDKLFVPMKDVWRDGHVVNGWRNALIVQS